MRLLIKIIIFPYGLWYLHKEQIKSLRDQINRLQKENTRLLNVIVSKNKWMIWNYANKEDNANV